MNAAIFRSYTTTAVVVALLVLSTTVSSQNLNDGSFQSDGGDFDYQDFQFSPRPTPPSVAVPQRSAARPRSPAIASASGQSKITPTPVAILKQINRHNEDGSYTYGFEGGDGSFKIETKLATGEVIGKYGYVDDSGKVRTVEYGANKYGFQPAGEGITIPPVNFGNDTDDSFNTDSPPPQAADEGQSFFQIPVRPAKPPPAPKRKQAKQPQQVLVDQRVPRPQIPQQPYFVREPEDVQIRPQPQRPSTSPSDFNNLQLLLGNELRDLPPFQFRANENAPQRENPQQFQFRPNEIPPQRAGFQSVAQEEAPEEPIPRPFPQSLTIPSVFNQQPQFAQAPEQIDFNQFDVSGAPRVPSGAFRASARGQPKPKSRPQVLFIAQPEDIQQPSAVRRNSNVGPETRSILDELLKQYAIPNASPAINDFSFSQNAQ